MVSLWSRAITDSKKWLLDHIVAWFLAFLLPGIGTLLSTWLVPPNTDLKTSALLGFLGGLSGLVLLVLGTLLWNLFRAPYKQLREIEKATAEREKEESCLEVKPVVGRREADYVRTEHLMWAELQVTNTSTKELRDVQVNIKQCLDVIERQNSINDFALWDSQHLQPFFIYWSERQAQPKQMNMVIPSGATRSALVAYQNNSNGGQFNFNSLNHEWIADGIKINVEISNLEAVLWNGSFYIKCHPNYVGKTLSEYRHSRFEFIEWDTWTKGKSIHLLGAD